MAGVRGRHVARATLHVRAREPLQNFFNAPAGQTGVAAEPKVSGRMGTRPRLLIPLDLLKFSTEEMACSLGESQWLIASGGQRKYGTTSTNATRPERLVQYDVQENDTLQGIALKFNVTMEQLKRANKLWTNDSLHVRRTLQVPVPLEPSGGLPSASSLSPAGEDESRRPAEGPDRPTPSADDFLRQVDSVIASSRRSVCRLQLG